MFPKRSFCPLSMPVVVLLHALLACVFVDPVGAQAIEPMMSC